MYLAYNTESKEYPLQDVEYILEGFTCRLVCFYLVRVVHVESSGFGCVVLFWEGQQVFVVEYFLLECYGDFWAVKRLLQLCAYFNFVIAYLIKIYFLSDSIYRHTDGLRQSFIKHVQILSSESDKHNNPIILMLVGLDLHTQSTLQPWNSIFNAASPVLLGSIHCIWTSTFFLYQSKWD